jgi:hypothetical protein
MRYRSSRRLLGVLLLAFALVPAAASATQTARISAQLNPEHLGAATAISLAFNITGDEAAPSALLHIQLAYPGNLGFATSGLGLAACDPQSLELVGSTVCPPDSVMGHGSALVEIQIGPELVQEEVLLTLFAGPSDDGYLHLLIYADGRVPVKGQVLLSGVLLPGRMEVSVPPIPSLPQSPYVSVARMRITLGGALTYYERRHGRTVAYRPPGVGLPSRCPRGGFPFGASFSFMDGTLSRARTAVACPARHRKAR